MHHVMGLGHREGTDDKPYQQGNIHPEQETHAQVIEQRAGPEHGDDKSDRPPDTNAAVTAGIAAQMIEGHVRAQGQRGHPEKGEHREHRKHSGKSGHAKEQGEDAEREQAGETNDAQALTEPVCERPPKIRPEKPHQLHQRHQNADIPGRERQGLEIEPEVRRKAADKGEVEKQAEIRQ